MTGVALCPALISIRLKTQGQYFCLLQLWLFFTFFFFSFLFANRFREKTVTALDDSDIYAFVSTIYECSPQSYQLLVGSHYKHLIRNFVTKKSIFTNASQVSLEIILICLEIN